MNQTLKPYLARSFTAHLAGAAALALLWPQTAKKIDPVYTIDFVGGRTTTITNFGPPAASPGKTATLSGTASPSRAPQLSPDEIATKGRHRSIVLPRPSLFAASEGQSQRRQTSASLAGPGDPSHTTVSPMSASPTRLAGAGTGVSTDMPNFPYPWYLAQIRLMLWQSWQKQMPRTSAEGIVGFSILPNGSFTDLLIESSSGDTDFDKATLAAVQTAAPFPALPIGFHERFLKIHLTLKSEDAWH